jgi:hypothetical protein
VRALRCTLTALVLLVACGESSTGPLAPLLNRCTQAFECDNAKGDSCNLELGICTQQLASEPYRYALQVIAEPNADAGQLAPLTVVPNEPFTSAINLGNLTVRSAVTVRGSVLGSDGRPLQAEVIFTPRENSTLARGVDVFTRPAAGGIVYAALLDPDTTYDVLTYPLGVEASRSYPPGNFTVTTTQAEQTQDFRYPVLEELTGQILDENFVPAPAGLKIKLRSRDQLLATSSIGDLSANGSFSLFAPREVLAAPAAHELVLDLSGTVAPQNVQIAFDLSKQRPDGKWTIPQLPAVVQFSGSVEVSALLNAPDSNIDARLTWISDFALPTEPGNVRGGDWCQLKLPGQPKDTFRCSARVDTSVGADLRVAVGLLPGDYKVFVAPTGAFDDPQRVATAAFEESIRSQLTGQQQSGRAFRLAAATLFNGRVLNAGGQPMPAVTVTANALGIQDNLDEVALFNRSDQQTSARDGTFKLAVDEGLYDLIATPPEGSGYAWVVTQNRRIDGTVRERLGGIDFPVTPQVPVLARGRVVNSSDTPIAAARVDAFALVPDLASGGERAIRIAHAVSNSMGEFVLQMPQSVGARDDTSLDGGVLGDAGAQ